MDKLIRRSYFDIRTREFAGESPHPDNNVEADPQNLESGEQLQSDQQGDSSELYVEGYAIVFNTPSFLFTKDGVDYYEQISSGALDDADMSDVIFNYDHAGKVLARTRNNTLELTVDEKGLFVRARLDGTEEGRTLHHEIKGGYIDKMSFSYTVVKEKESYDDEKKLFITSGVKKLYDVSAVSIPVYEDTYISARAADLSGSIAERKDIISAGEAELLKERILLKAKI